MIDIRMYRDAHGRVPVDEWMNSLQDIRARQRIQVRIRRLSLGLEGDWKSVGKGVRELRIQEGRGYRLYYSWTDDNTAILLCGGDKASQKRDVQKAIAYLKDYHG